MHWLDVCASVCERLYVCVCVNDTSLFVIAHISTIQLCSRAMCKQVNVAKRFFGKSSISPIFFVLFFFPIKKKKNVITFSSSFISGRLWHLPLVDHGANMEVSLAAAGIIFLALHFAIPS